VWIGAPRPVFVEGAAVVAQGVLVVGGMVLAARIIEALLAPPRRGAA